MSAATLDKAARRALDVLREDVARGDTSHSWNDERQRAADELEAALKRRRLHHEEISLQVAVAAFHGRRGHGGGSIGRRVLTMGQLRQLLLAALERA